MFSPSFRAVRRCLLSLLVLWPAAAMGQTVLHDELLQDDIGNNSNAPAYHLSSAGSYSWSGSIDASKDHDDRWFVYIAKGYQLAGLTFEYGSGGPTTTSRFIVYSNNTFVVDHYTGKNVSEQIVNGPFSVHSPTFPYPVGTYLFNLGALGTRGRSNWEITIQVASTTVAPESDSDGDGVIDENDLCPNTEFGGLVDSVGCANTQVDADLDNICDPGAESPGYSNCTGVDNCPGTSNQDQFDFDGDGLGDACDPDDENDGIPDASDNCPFVPNPDQGNDDGDLVGNACDSDDDNDGVSDKTDICPNSPRNAHVDSFGCAAVQVDSDLDNICNPNPPSIGPAWCSGVDNCPTVPNGWQFDEDNDGEGDACDFDDDNDGADDDDDNCPAIPNPDQANNDNDAFGDACDDDDDNDGIPDSTDNCPLFPNPGQLNGDDDGLGDPCDGDLDNDGIENPDDNCPMVSNPDQAELDNDGAGNACDDDDDGDGVPDVLDQCPLTPAQTENGCTGGPVDPPCTDADHDMVCDKSDNCLGVPNSNQLNFDADEVGDACDHDDDNDGIPDAVDECPFENAYTPNGCEDDPDDPPSCNDADHDEICDTVDNCPLVANPNQLNSDSDSSGNACDPDDDNDGTPDSIDDCPLTSGTGANGCDPEPIDPCPDADADTICNNADNCPNALNPDQSNFDGDAGGDACDSDDDNDGIPDVLDQCPRQFATTPNGCAGSAPNPTGDGNPCADADDDDICDTADNCENAANDDQADADNDGVGDECDNCVNVANSDQADANDDGTGDACTPDGSDDNDDDSDGVGMPGDNCPNVANANQMDRDTDGVGDACDNCALVANADQADDDEDGTGNACETIIPPPGPDDADGDGVADDEDNCPNVANSGQTDADGNGFGDACDEPVAPGPTDRPVGTASCGRGSACGAMGSIMLLVMFGGLATLRLKKDN